VSRFPPNLLAARVTATSTSAGYTGTTVIPAPGAGQRLRIWRVTFTIAEPSAGATTYACEWQLGGVAIARQAHAWPNPGSANDYFPGGVALATNASLTGTHALSVGVGIPVQLLALYTVEPTT
jgi:hypothetical protein